jgi:hypothetical protein
MTEALQYALSHVVCCGSKVEEIKNVIVRAGVLQYLVFLTDR